MNSKIPGLHHVTAIASDPQRNLDFYVGFSVCVSSSAPSILTIREPTIFTSAIIAGRRGQFSPFFRGPGRGAEYAGPARSKRQRSRSHRIRSHIGWSV